MNRRELERKIDIILSQVSGLPLSSKAFGLYKPKPQNPPSVWRAAPAVGIPADSVAALGDFTLSSEPITLLLTLNALNPEHQPDFPSLLLKRLNDTNVHVVTIAIIELKRLDALRDPLATSAPDFLIRLWNGVDSHLTMQSHVFSDADLDLLTDLVNLVTLTLAPLLTPLGKVGAGMLVGLTGAMIQHGPALVEVLAQVSKRITLVRYRRLQKELLQGENPEINTDKRDLTLQMGRLGFRPAIADAFGEVEKRLSAAIGPFDFKGCMDLLRTAFEELMEDSAKQVGTKRRGQLPHGPRLNHFSPWREYLEAENVLTKDQGGMAQQLYNYLSNAGSHQLGAGPKEACLSKNMVIELGLMVVDQVGRV